MSATLSIDEGKQLLQLCKAGKLFEVQEWIEAENSISLPAELRNTPLDVAIDKGFHSLVELLARHEPSQEVRNRALSRAVFHKRLDFIELLVTHGAQIEAIPFVDVLLSWDPKIIRYFIERGADLITSSPFAHAFGEKIRTALGPWKECKQTRPELADQLQEQIDRALRHFCFEGDLKWVSLLMWAGANPRSRGPRLYEKYELDDSEYEDALSLATFHDAKIMKRLGPNSKKDNLDRLLAETARHGHPELVEYLLEIGANANHQPDGGSTALAESLGWGIRDAALWSESSLNWYGTRTKASKYAVEKALKAIDLLLQSGARWRPKDKSEVTEVRRSLLECQPEVTTEIVQRLVKSDACFPEVINELVRTPAIRNHLAPESRKLRLLGFDVRTPEQRREDERQKEAERHWAIKQLASRYNREEIFQQIWSEPIQHVAKKYNVSDVYLAKVCKKLDIPRPGRGYWAKKSAGKSIKQPALPELSI
jgi:hypothetical protein